jgi:glucokinase
VVGAIDIGGTKIAVGMIDENGRVLSRVECPTDVERYPQALADIEKMLHKAAQEAGVTLTGIGIGSTGPVDPRTGEVGAKNFLSGWEGSNPVRDLTKLFNVPVAMENDADAAALAEAGWGAGKNKSRLVYVTFGTGIGCGVILDGQLYRGADYSHPEIGHCLIDASGPACPCGFHGCWESLAAGPAMTAWVESQAPPDYPHRANISAKRICELAREGDALALKAVARETYYLGLGLANLVTLFVPDVIVLSGSVMKSADLFLDGIREIIRRSCGFVPHQKTDLVLASLGDNTNLIGAARVWYHRYASGRPHV